MCQSCYSVNAFRLTILCGLKLSYLFILSISLFNAQAQGDTYKKKDIFK